METNVNYSDSHKNNGVELAKDTFIKSTPVDIIENKNEIKVKCDMPGVPKENLDISYEENILTIIGWQNNDAPEGYNLLHADYKTGTFKRSFNILTSINADKISAATKDGVLTVTLPKHEYAKPKKIEIAG